jgi:hypothetical protein
MSTSLSENMPQEEEDTIIRRETIESSKRLPKWYLQTFQDVKNDEILPGRTKSKAKTPHQEEKQQATNYIHEEGMYDDDMSNYDQIMSIVSNDTKSISIENASKNNHWMCANEK